ncbi:uncharacterized protein LOC128337384 [Hemicordylus capensis]|uniref:uncharacterized protein LOC128337384 n=1 Tax=Hemicordylus capensis TaxID=884348 RepID=UPI002303560D|nr:uncharacterized protein LOC128337384 [Hemicordylus capensis]
MNPLQAAFVALPRGRLSRFPQGLRGRHTGRLPVKNAKVTAVPGGEADKRGFSQSWHSHPWAGPHGFARLPSQPASPVARRTPGRLGLAPFGPAMLLLPLLLSGLLARVPPWGGCAPPEADPGDQLPPDSSVITLNDSCREQVLWQAGSRMLQVLRLDRPPQIEPEGAAQVREAWTKAAVAFPALSSRGQHLNISANQTLLIQRGSCIQISHRVTLEDLGWQNWVLHPNSFVFTDCLGRHCHKAGEGSPPPLWMQECGLGQSSQQPDADSKQGCCCQTPRAHLSIAFLKEDGSLVLKAVQMGRSCQCSL